MSARPQRQFAPDSAPDGARSGANWRSFWRSNPTGWAT